MPDKKRAKKVKKCDKCGYEGKEVKKVDKNKDIFLCSICRKFIPRTRLEDYIAEKIDWRQLESFRKFKENKNLVGMEAKARMGNVVNRAPFGFRLENKKLIPYQEERLKVERIFREFLENEISLNKLSKKYNFSVNGIKKLLRNFTYIGKVKFDGQIHPGNHNSIISTELFNKVQSKLERLNLK